MASFAEFENLLRDRYPDHNQHGAEFERVAKWMLETHPTYVRQLRKVWHYQDWPGYWGPDDGVDLVAEHNDGSLWAVQVKCFKQDHSLTKSELDSFLAASGREVFAQRLLIATTDLVGRTADRTLKEQEKPVRRFMRDAFLKAPLVWPDDPVTLAGGGPQPKREPRPHQAAAIEAVSSGLEDRGQLIMACGTGKTLTSLWINEALGAERSLVLVPSLTLLSQLVSEWTASAQELFAFLPVCSDETVARGADAAVMFASDLQYPVTTDPNEIAAFLKQPGPSVVFSTYQSSPQVAAAQADPSVPAFDVVFADEAHRCAGKVSSDYGTVLDAEQIRASKRLFMTATPRTFTARVTKKASEQGLEVASMDDEDVFGSVLHRLSFNQAITDGLLTDYQVVVVLVDDARIHELIKERYLVETDTGLADDAKTLAGYVGVAKAIRDHNLSRTITFHSRVNTAKKFANTLPDVIDWMPPDQRPAGEVITGHVSGDMATGLRNNKLNQLRNIEPGQHGLLANARCLSEGIDVPTLDGVAFVDPRRSQVDIVQGLGRAIRKSDNKAAGTIVIPVYLSNTEDPETAIAESDFKPVWGVVNALRSHDDDLAEQLDEIRTKRFQDASRDGAELPANVIIDAPTGVSAEFVNAIRVQIVERATSEWLDGFAALLQYVTREGHARVPVAWVEDIGARSVRLGSWVNTQRTTFAVEQMGKERVRQLEAVKGWVWDAVEADFEDHFEALTQFVDRESHARVPSNHEEFVGGRPYSLGSWAARRRSEYQNGKLARDRVELFESVPGWAWSLKEESLQRNVLALQQFVQREGHGRVPPSHKEQFSGEPVSLGTWVKSMRRKESQGALDPQLRSRLEAVPGWVWDPYQSGFDLHLRALRQFADREGHAKVLQKHVERVGDVEVRLGAWVNKRRAEYKKGKLSKERIELLDAVPGWIWDPGDASFDLHLRALRQFADREGHVRMGDKHVERVGDVEVSLGTWVSGRRDAHKKGKLNKEHVELLDAVPGWVWDPRRASFDLHLRALRQFADREGHAKVLQKHVERVGDVEVRLGAWVSKRRAEHKNGKLSKERIELLDAVPGWTWDTR